MTELSAYATPAGAALAIRSGESEHSVNKKKSDYYKALNEYNEIRQEYNRLMQEQLQAQHATQSSSHTFVNSYGEATTREITSATYKAAQQKLNKAIQAWMKNYR